MLDKSLRDLEYDKILKILAKQSKSTLARERCLALRPIFDYEALLLAMEESDDMLQLILKHGELPLGALEDISEIIKFLELGAIAGPGDLLMIARQLRLADHLLTLREQALQSEKKEVTEQPEPEERDILYDNLEESFTSAWDLIAKLSPLSALAKRIDDSILNDEELKDSASPDLYQIRRQIRNYQEDIQRQLEKILRNSTDLLQDSIITLRGDRYVLPVKSENKNKIPGIVHDSSASGATVFIEPMQVVQLNNKIREMRDEEEREIHRILKELSALVFAQERVCRNNQEIFTRLDFNQAKAKLALALDAHRPKLNREGKIILKAARHPLIDPKKVVAIDFELGLSFTSLLITGPNTGGKTVSLKTCGLLTLMAMSGLHIPAKSGSVISIWDQVMADIGDEQSIAQSLSTFSAHMTQVIRICKQAGPRSLILLDELGAGTDPSEGAALAIAILDYLKAKGASIVASTHYPELKGYAMNTANVSNASCEFDSVSMRPTYKLLIGVPGVSNAIAISTRLGLPEEIIRSAQALISDEGAKFQSLIEAIEKSERESRRMKEEMEALNQAAREAQKKHRKEIDKLAEEREEILRQARQEAYEILTKAEETAEAQLKTVRGIGGSLQEAEEAKQKLREQRQDLAESMSRDKLRAGIDRPLTEEDLELGEHYEDVISGFKGQLTELADKQNRVQLSKGNLNLRVDLENLRPCEESKPESKSKNFSQRALPKAKARGQNALSSQSLNAGSELYLLGYRVVEALDAVDDYLDKARMLDLPYVRIVHGKGSGALRHAVRDFLKHDKRVAKYGDAPFGAGDAGVTVVEFN